MRHCLRRRRAARPGWRRLGPGPALCLGLALAGGGEAGACGRLNLMVTHLPEPVPIGDSVRFRIMLSGREGCPPADLTLHGGLSADSAEYFALAPPVMAGGRCSLQGETAFRCARPGLPGGTRVVAEVAGSGGEAGWVALMVRARAGQAAPVVAEDVATLVP